MTYTLMEQENTPYALVNLAAQYTGDKEYPIRFCAAKALAALGGPMAENVLFSIAENREEDIDIRTDAVIGLGRVASLKSTPRIEAFLQDPASEMRLTALTVLKDRVEHVSPGALTALLLEEDAVDSGDMDWNPMWDAQLLALKALAAQGSAEAVGPLMTFHEREQARDMVSYVFQALLKAGTKVALDYAREKLRRGEEWERRAILDAAGEWPADDLAGDIRMSLVDRDSGARAAAAHALAAIEGPRCQASLFLLLNDDVPHVRETALALLAGLGGVEGYEDHVIPLLRDPAPKVREAAVRALAALPSTETTIAEWRRIAVEEKDDSVAARAASALAAANADEAFPVLSAIPGDSSRGTRLRIMMVSLLQSTYGSRAAEALLPCLETEPRQVAVAAAAALMRLQSQAAADLLEARLREALAQERSVPPEAGAVSAEDNTEGENEGETLCENEEIVLIGGKKAVRSPGEAPGRLTPAECAVALGEARFAPAAQMLMDCLVSRDESLAAAAAAALGRLKYPGAMAAMREALKNGAPELRRHAIVTLSAIGGPDAVVAVISALSEDTDETTRAQAAESLAAMDLAESAHLLALRLYDDQSALVRKACVDGLGRVSKGKEAAAAALWNALFDFSRFSELRPAIHQSLRTLAQDDVVARHMESTLNDPARRTDRWVALEAMAALHA